MLKLFIFTILYGLSQGVPVSDNQDQCGYNSCTQAEPELLNVHIVPHTHDDVGWLKTVDQYYYGSNSLIQKAGVQYILDSVVKELWEDPKRRFMYVETAFFWKWWTKQNDAVKQKVHTLVREGRLQFVGGAWSMNDEADTHYQSTIDQFTWGLSKLNETFGKCGMPRVGWQIDPFGHSREFASLLSGMGFDGLFLGRIDYEDKGHRLLNKEMEMVWRGDDDLGKSSDIFTGVLYNTYSPPPGFCFDVLCADEPIIDDQNSPMYNVEQRVFDFLSITTRMSNAYRTNNILVTMGEDFNYQDAAMWFMNLDKLIQYTNLKAAKEGLNIKLFYSTPDCYLKAVKDSNPTLPSKTDDFFPYASDPHSYWTGYFTSRPTVKYFEREGNNYLQMVKQLQVTTGLEIHNNFIIDELKSAMGIMQHHDAITGTEKQHVTFDYERILNQAIEDSLTIARQGFNHFTQGYALAPPLFSYDRCKFNESQCSTSEDSDQFVVTLYNPLAWKVEASPVAVPVTDGHYIIVAPNGQEIESQLTEIPEHIKKIPTRFSNATHELKFLAHNIKSLGVKSFYIRKSQNPTKRQTPSYPHGVYYQNIQNPMLTPNFWNHGVYFQPYQSRIEENDKDKVYTNHGVYSQPREHNQNENPGRVLSNLGVKSKPYLVPDEPKVLGEYNPIGVDFDMLSDKENSYISDLEKIINVAKNQAKPNKPVYSGDELRMLSDDPRIVEVRDDDVIGNENLKLRYNKENGDITHVIINGQELKFSLKLLYYQGHQGENHSPSDRASGAYIFRPNDTSPIDLNQKTYKVIRGDILDQIEYKADFVSGAIRIYKHEKLNYIEHDWIVGPIPTNDGIGKEVIVKYITDIDNKGIFYTDSNGRQVLERKVNSRPDWNLTVTEPVAGNYYPVTSHMYIRDGKYRMSVLVDRAEGGTSIENGVIEVMLHRRLLYDDAFGVGEALNERIEGVGLIVRGTHRVMIYDDKTLVNRANEQKNIYEMHLKPIPFVSNSNHVSLTQWLTLNNCDGAINGSIPSGIHLLTLEPFKESKLLIRLENYFDKTGGPVSVDLNQLFKNMKLKSLKETTLAANQWLEDYEKWEWTSDLGSESLNNNVDNGMTIEVQPKQIRTFVASYVYKN